jgi:cell division protein ZapA
MPSYTITVNGLELSFKTDADEQRIQAAQALLEERFAELSRGGKYISREKLLTLLALGMADDYLELQQKMTGLEARMQELLERRQ